MSCMRACGRLSLTHRKYTSTFMLPEIGCKMLKKRKCDTIHVHHVAAICSCLNVSYAKMCFMCVCVQDVLLLSWLISALHMARGIMQCYLTHTYTHGHTHTYSHTHKRAHSSHLVLQSWRSCLICWGFWKHCWDLLARYLQVVQACVLFVCVHMHVVLLLCVYCE
jgi:hypothetical protein